MAERTHLLNIAGRMDEAVALGNAACAIADEIGDRLVFTNASHNLAQAYYNQGNVRAAADVLAGVLHATDMPRPPVALGSLSMLVPMTRSLALSFAGEDEAAREMADAARAVAEATGRPYDLAYAALAGGLARLRTAPGEAADLLLDGVSACEVGQIPQATPALHAALGHLLLRSGDWNGAASWLARSYGACLEQGRSMVMCWAAAGLAHALWELGDRETASKLAAEAVEAARRNGYRGYLAVALRLRAALLAPADAFASLQEAEALAAELGLSHELADCRVALAALDA